MPGLHYSKITFVYFCVFALYVFFISEFVLGTSANALHFQMYLLKGLVQWNEAHGEDICYGGQLLQYCNALSQQLLGLKLAQDYTSPGKYTGIVFMQT